MWGALIFLLFFLVIAPGTRDPILAMLEQAQLRVAVEAPLSYFLLVVLGGSALVSALIMKFWPKVAEKPTPIRVWRQYQGQAEAELARAPQAPAFGLRAILAWACAVLPGFATLACARVLRDIGGSDRVRRVAAVPRPESLR